MTNPQLQTVLVIDDSVDIHHLVTARLASERISIHHAYSAVEGLEAARDLRPDLILLDLDMPDADGLTLCEVLKDDKDLVHVPVIFLTGTLDVETKVQAFELGAVDYVTKPFDGIELKARVRSALRTKRYHDLLSTKAQIDALTGLWNRKYLDDQLAVDIAGLHRGKGPVSLLMLDIDHFKLINDTYGHPFGDTVIQKVADELNQMSRATDVVCRYGGEEFAVILRDTDSLAARNFAERLRQHVARLEFNIRDKIVKITISIGLVGSDQLKSTPEDPAALIEMADQALYRAKSDGRNRIVAAFENKAA